MNKLKRLERVERAGFKTAIYTGLDREQQPPTKVIEEILKYSKHGTVNIRTYKDNQDLGCPFKYGLKNVEEVEEQVNQLHKEGYHVIINETIDKDDGGVSGVAIGGIMGFAPFNTVRSAMQNGDECILPSYIAVRMLGKVYNLNDREMEDLCRIYRLAYCLQCRVEFSVHPTGDKVLVWDIGKLNEEPIDPRINLGNSNEFSRFLGEKAYNLLLVESIGLGIPKTKAKSRYLKDSFRLDSSEEDLEGNLWTRTSPIEKMAGKHLTKRGVVKAEGLFNEEVPTVMYQEEQKVDWSGSAIWRDKNHMVIEGVRGYGDKFQVGEQAPKMLPQNVRTRIKKYMEDINSLLTAHFGEGEKAFSIEWGIIDTDPVLFQINFMEQDNGRGTIIVPNKLGEPIEYEEYPTEKGLDQFRRYVETLPEGKGIKLVGNIGVTSHFCDILRQSGIPSFLKRESV